MTLTLILFIMLCIILAGDITFGYRYIYKQGSCTYKDFLRGLTGDIAIFLFFACWVIAMIV